MEFSYYNKYINRKVIGRCDVTPIFREPVVFFNLIKDFIKLSGGKKYDVIVGFDALGFVIASAVAVKLKKPLVLVRKGGKLPGIKGTIIRKSFVDYTKKKKSFEMSKGCIKRGDKVLIIDEWIETGAQMKAAISLIEKQGGKVERIVVFSADLKKSTKILFDKYDCRAVRIVDKIQTVV